MKDIPEMVHTPSIPEGVLKIIRLAHQGMLCTGDLVATRLIGVCEVVNIETRFSFSVKALSTGRYYRVNGIDFGPNARVVHGALEN